MIRRTSWWVVLSALALACGDDGKGTEPPARPGDSDADGFTVDEGDCDDADPTTNPRAIEIAYDGVDSNCDGASDLDRDGDGHDAADHGGDDCDDGDPDTSPSAPDPCDERDNNCDDAVDDEFAATHVDAYGVIVASFATVEEAVAGAVPGEAVRICAGEWTVPALDISGLSVKGYGEVVLRAADPGETVVTAMSGPTNLFSVEVTGATAGVGIRLGGGTLWLNSVDVVGNRTGVEVVGGAGTVLTGEIVRIRDNVKEDGVGAGLYASGPVVVELEADVDDNLALDGGGAAFEDGATLAEGGLSFGGNTALRDGGGLYARDAVLTGLVWFDENTAGRDGGGAWLRGTTAEALSASSNVALGNGGGVAFVDSRVDELRTCSANEAGGDGGAAHVDGGSQVTLSDFSTFAANVAAVGGGALRVVGGGVITGEAGVEFEDNAPDDLLTDVGAWSGAELAETFTCTGDGGC